jgi:hypothetical protein
MKAFLKTLVMIGIFSISTSHAAEITEYPTKKIIDLSSGSPLGSIILEHPGHQRTLYKCNDVFTSISLARDEYAVIWCPSSESAQLVVQVYKDFKDAIITYGNLKNKDF